MELIENIPPNIDINITASLMYDVSDFNLAWKLISGE
jgi:hypothetical protein